MKREELEAIQEDLDMGIVGGLEGQHAERLLAYVDELESRAEKAEASRNAWHERACLDAQKYAEQKRSAEQAESRVTCLEKINSELCREKNREAARVRELERKALPPESTHKEAWGRLVELTGKLPGDTGYRILGEVHVLRSHEWQVQWETMPDGKTYPPWTLRENWEKAEARADAAEAKVRELEAERDVLLANTPLAPLARLRGLFAESDGHGIEPWDGFDPDDDRFVVSFALPNRRAAISFHRLLSALLSPDQPAEAKP